MPSITDHLARAADGAGELLPLAVVPLVATLLDFGRMNALLADDDTVLSVTFGFPQDVTTLWSFLNVQVEGVSVGAFGLVALSPLLLVGTLVGVVVSSLLAAGYLGSIDAGLDGGFDFVAELRRYARPFLGYGLLEAAVGLALVGAGVLVPPLLIPAILLVLVLAYLFYAAPYLVVTRELPLVPALARSYALAVSDGRYLGFFLGYVLISAALSVPTSWLAFNGGPLGAALAVLLSAPVALVLNIATMLFVRSLDGPEPAPAQSNIPVDM